VAARREDGRLVGFQVLEPFGPYTRAFDHVATLGTYVDLAERRQGIATALFAATFDAARRAPEGLREDLHVRQIG
jgi:L-amino acid N-acyltransferase YncA